MTFPYFYILSPNTDIHYNHSSYASDHYISLKKHISSENQTCITIGITKTKSIWFLNNTQEVFLNVCLLRPLNEILFSGNAAFLTVSTTTYSTNLKWLGPKRASADPTDRLKRNVRGKENGIQKSWDLNQEIWRTKKEHIPRTILFVYII